MKRHLKTTLNLNAIISQKQLGASKIKQNIQNMHIDRMEFDGLKTPSDLVVVQLVTATLEPPAAPVSREEFTECA
jgi:hypothetical protein